MTNEEKTAALKSILDKANIKYKRAEAYGRQIVVTCWSRSAAEQVEYIFRKSGLTIRGNIKTTETNKENQGSFLLPTRHEVHRVYACI